MNRFEKAHVKLGGIQKHVSVDLYSESQLTIVSGKPNSGKTLHVNGMMFAVRALRPVLRVLTETRLEDFLAQSGEHHHQYVYTSTNSPATEDIVKALQLAKEEGIKDVFIEALNFDSDEDAAFCVKYLVESYKKLGIRITVELITPSRNIQESTW